MINSNDLRNLTFSPEQNGYNVDEVKNALNDAADTIEGYINENKELYRKMEILAKRIEEYREEEDSIKHALITAQKMADKIEKESKETADTLISNSEATAKKTVDEANEKSESIISEAREFSAKLIKDKNEEADAIIADANRKASDTISAAEKKANDAINSSKTIAQNVLDQAKEISDELIGKSKAEAEAYKVLSRTVKSDAKALISKLVDLYSEQLEVLKNANLEAGDDEAEEEVENIRNDVNSLVSEIEEIQNAIPDEVVIDKELDDVAEEIEEIEEAEEDTEEIREPEAAEEFEDISSENNEEDEETAEEDEEENTDPMEAVEAFSNNEFTPIDSSGMNIPEIGEEAEMEKEDESLFEDENAKRPFESYFNINNNDAHYDRSQTISLVPPEDDEEEEQPKFKGFFKKKK